MEAESWQVLKPTVEELMRDYRESARLLCIKRPDVMKLCHMTEVLRFVSGIRPEYGEYLYPERESALIEAKLRQLGMLPFTYPDDNIQLEVV